MSCLHPVGFAFQTWNSSALSRRSRNPAELFGDLSEALEASKGLGLIKSGEDDETLGRGAGGGEPTWRLASKQGATKEPVPLFCRVWGEVEESLSFVYVFVFVSLSLSLRLSVCVWDGLKRPNIWGSGN